MPIGYFLQEIPDFTTKLDMTFELRKSNAISEWTTTDCQIAFGLFKVELAFAPLTHSLYLEKEVTLTTYALEIAILWILSQVGHPGIYVSRGLSNAELEYTNNEREALAIVYVIGRLCQLFQERGFKMIVPQKPFEFSFPLRYICRNELARSCQFE